MDAWQSATFPSNYIRVVRGIYNSTCITHMSVITSKCTMLEISATSLEYTHTVRQQILYKKKKLSNHNTIRHSMHRYQISPKWSFFTPWGHLLEKEQY